MRRRRGSKRKELRNKIRDSQSTSTKVSCLWSRCYEGFGRQGCGTCAIQQLALCFQFL